MVVTDRLAWYASRARAMSPTEMAWRAGTKVIAVATPLVRAREAAVLDSTLDWHRAYAGFCSAVDRPVLLDGKRAVELHAAMPADVDAVVAAAEQVGQLRFGYFGQQPVAFPGDRIDWNLDPRTGDSWPSAPASRIDHRTCPGDPKWIWELNRLQHLPWLAQAWLFTGERRFADIALEQLDSWMEQNPPGRGIAWRGGFEAGVRAMSVAIAVQGLRDAPGLNLERYRRVVTVLVESARYAWRARSRFSSANNHLLGEMAGVATVAMLFPETAGSTRALARALAVLTREASRQILPDGAGAEQSFAYQAFASDLLIIPAALLQLRGDRVPVPIVDALRRGSEFQRALVAAGDPVPRYGDDDGGFALRLHADPIPSLGRHLAAAAVVTGDHGPGSGGADLAAAWLAGPDAAPGRSQAVPVRSRYAPDGGLVMIRRGTQRIMMDVGPLGYLSIAAHGHADALAVTISANGQEVIGDPGTGSYYAEPEWRTSFRGTRMHATASVDDLDQSVMSGMFLWTRHAATTVRAVDLARGVVEAEHDGYTRLDEPVTHRRYLIAPPDTTQTVVIDLFTGTGAHRVRTSWPLAPDLAVRGSGSAERVLVQHLRRDDVPVLTVTTAATTPATPYTVRGDEESRLGWWSNRFESRVPAWLVGAVAEAPLPIAVATVLDPAGAEAPADLVVRLDGAVIDVSWSRSSIRIDTGVPGAVSVDLATGPTGGT